MTDEERISREIMAEVDDLACSGNTDRRLLWHRVSSAVRRASDAGRIDALREVERLAAERGGMPGWWRPECLRMSANWSESEWK